MIPLPSQPKIVKKEGAIAVFEIDSLYPGYGVTIGNSLRRVLLSSLQGSAVTQMKVSGVSHEFSTIPGVQEDLTILMLNLKMLRFRVFSDEPQMGKLHIKGEKEAKGSDFELPSQVELINKDCHIATLTAKSSDLEIEIIIEKGVGYSAREDRKKEKLEIGAIALDAIFTPLKKVSFKVENMRVGERTDFDKLSLEIETDGTILPETAFSQAAKILVGHFSMLSETFAEEIPAPESIKEEAAAKRTKKNPDAQRGRGSEQKRRRKTGVVKKPRTRAKHGTGQAKR
ncbi:MAG: DNA-directed RNA polymerase subunit alpha [Patescibacteria group bacterium]